jgi:hypothetical protein
MGYRIRISDKQRLDIAAGFCDVNIKIYVKPGEAIFYAIGNTDDVQYGVLE